MGSRAHLAILLLAALSASAEAPRGWLYQHDARRSGCSATAGPTEWKKKWVVEGDYGSWHWAPVAVAADGGAFVVGTSPSGLGYALYAIAADGKTRWTCELTEDAWAAPAPTADGGAIVGLLDGGLVRVGADGKPVWRFEAKGPITSSPAIAGDGTIVFGCRDDCAYAVSADGAPKWTFRTGGWVQAAPAIAADGTVYVASWDRTLYALSPEGKERWRFATARPISACPVVAADGAVYVASEDGSLYALSSEGKQRWSFATKGWIPFAPCIAPSGDVVVASNDHGLYALAPDGSLRWKVEAGQPSSNLVCDARGTVYFCGYSTLRTFGADGTPSWTREQIGDCSLALADDGTLYVQQSSMLYALRP